MARYYVNARYGAKGLAHEASDELSDLRAAQKDGPEAGRTLISARMCIVQSWLDCVLSGRAVGCA